MLQSVLESFLFPSEHVFLNLLVHQATHNFELGEVVGVGDCLITHAAQTEVAVRCGVSLPHLVVVTWLGIPAHTRQDFVTGQ